jgi:delta1-piperideine-2-carboxylate reductase
MAHGDLSIAAREGRTVPPGTGVDAAGASTTDPAAILDGGALLPFGGHKGAAIAMTIEILAAALTGGRVSFEVDWSGHPGATIPCTGQFLLLIDPARGGDFGFAARVAALSDLVRSAGDGRLPGDRRLRNRARSLAEGVALTDEEAKLLRALA